MSRSDDRTRHQKTGRRISDYAVKAWVATLPPEVAARIATLPAEKVADLAGEWREVEALRLRRLRQAQHLDTTRRGRRIILWHRTRAGDARRILAHGFRDGAGNYGMTSLAVGVWLSNVPLDANEGTASGPLLRVALAMPVSWLVEREIVELGKGYREFVVPAAAINKSARVVLVSADDEPALRRGVGLASKKRRSPGVRPGSRQRAGPPNYRSDLPWVNGDRKDAPVRRVLHWRSSRRSRTRAG